MGRGINSRESIPGNLFLERNNYPSEWIPQEASIPRERKEYTPLLKRFKLELIGVCNMKNRLRLKKYIS
jgi:hypothetical protein